MIRIKKYYIFKYFFTVILIVLDFLFFFLVKFLPGKFLLEIIFNQIKLIPNLQVSNLLKSNLQKVVFEWMYNYNKNNFFSTCLSRSLSSSLILNLFKIENEIILGITRNAKGNIQPHALTKIKKINKLYVRNSKKFRQFK